VAKFVASFLFDPPFFKSIMPNNLSKLFIFVVTFLSIFFAANAQETDKTPLAPQPSVIVVGGRRTAVVIAKGSLMVAKQTAKATWNVSKFAFGEIAEPTAKFVVLKATPKVTSFLVKNSGLIIKKSTPIARKLLVTYLKL
jgi:hypothetical protein